MRTISSSVLFATGRSIDDIVIPKPNSCGTIVYYMGAKTAQVIGEGLRKAGWRDETPVAVIRNASEYMQEESRGTLAQLSDGTLIAVSPSIIIIGDTAGKAPSAGWFARRKKILMTGTNPERYARLGEIIHTPLIELVAPSRHEKIDTALRKLDTYDYLIFTSAHAVDFFFQRLSFLGGDARRCSKTTIAAVGVVTTKALLRYGITPDITPSRACAADLIDIFNERSIRGKHFLLPRSNLASNELPLALRRMGNRVDTLVAYQNRISRNPQKIDLVGIDAVIFTSPSCVRNFKKLYGRIPSDVELMVLGDTTKKAIGRHNGTITIIT